MRILRAMEAGIRAGLGIGPTLTYDGDPHSPRSVAFDRGMNLGERMLITKNLWGVSRRLWRGGPFGSLPEYL